MLRDLISSTEADAILAQETDWAGVADDVKTHHIGRACVYVQTQWDCSSNEDIDWTDKKTLTTEIKEAIAYYAYMDYKENLFGDPGTADVYHGSVRSVKGKLGPMGEDTTYFRGGKRTPGGTLISSGYPDALMEVDCIHSSDAVLLRT